MGLKGLWKRRENEILASVLLALLLLFIGIRYDYYYAMNDDIRERRKGITYRCCIPSAPFSACCTVCSRMPRYMGYSFVCASLAVCGWW